MTDKPKTPTSLQCLRCRADLEFKGTQQFHHGTRWGALGDIAELFVAKVSYDVCVCPQCGHVEFFEEGKAQPVP